LNENPRIGPAAVALVLIMALGSVLLWLGAPIGVIWFAAHTLSRVGSPTLAPLVMVMVALPLVMVVIAAILRRLDEMFSQVTGYDPKVHRISAPWNKGLTERVNRRSTVLDIVMVFSVLGAGVLAAVLWLVVKP
jgi:uncharacterized membrane protein